MLPSKPSALPKLQLYEVALPGLGFPKLIAARGVRRAIEIGLTYEDFLEYPHALLVTNATLSLISLNENMAKHTFGLLKEGREGELYYDSDKGWSRVEECGDG